jgi:dTDP-glucose 4,6-dehydratase
MRQKRILITGGTGFLGQNLVASLHKLDDRAEVSILGRQAHPLLRTTSHRIRYLQVDLVDKDETKNAVLQLNPQYIFHLAAQNPSVHYRNNPSSFLTSNISATYNLLEAARQLKDLKNLINISTYESIPDLLTPDYERQISPYAASKAGAALLVNSWRTTYQLPLTNLYFSNLFGPNQSIDKLIPQAFVRSLNRQAFNLYGSGKSVRYWLYVEDACKAIQRSTEVPPGEYAVLGDQKMTILQILGKIEELLIKSGLPHLRINKIDDRNQDFSLPYSNDVDNHLPHWSPTTPLDHGLNKTLEWIKNEHF